MADDKIHKSADEWRAELDDMQFAVTREGATERAFTGKYWNTKTAGTYKCVCCGEPLFASDTKYDSGSGWPSFTAPVDGGAVDTHADDSLGMRRTEVVCTKCGAHLGHVFPDGPRECGGLRYCINSAALDLDPNDE